MNTEEDKSVVDLLHSNLNLSNNILDSLNLNKIKSLKKNLKNQNLSSAKSKEENLALNNDKNKYIGKLSIFSSKPNKNADGKNSSKTNTKNTKSFNYDDSELNIFNKPPFFSTSNKTNNKLSRNTLKFDNTSDYSNVNSNMNSNRNKSGITAKMILDAFDNDIKEFHNDKITNKGSLDDYKIDDNKDFIANSIRINSKLEENINKTIKNTNNIQTINSRLHSSKKNQNSRNENNHIYEMSKHPSNNSVDTASKLLTNRLKSTLSKKVTSNYNRNYENMMEKINKRDSLNEINHPNSILSENLFKNSHIKNSHLSNVLISPKKSNDSHFNNTNKQVMKQSKISIRSKNPSKTEDKIKVVRLSPTVKVSRNGQEKLNLKSKNNTNLNFKLILKQQSNNKKNFNLTSELIKNNKYNTGDLSVLSSQRRKTVFQSNQIPEYNNIKNNILSHKNIDAKAITFSKQTSPLARKIYNKYVKDKESKFNINKKSSNIHSNNLDNELDNELNEKQRSSLAKRRSTLHKLRLSTKMDLNNSSDTYIREEVLYDFVENLNKNSAFGKFKASMHCQEITISILMTLNIILSIIDNEFYISETNTYLKDYMNDNKIPNMSEFVLKQMGERDISLKENIARTIIGIIILFSLVIIYLFHCNVVRMNHLSGRLSASDGIFTSNQWMIMFVEMLLCCIYIPPNVNYVMVGNFLGYLWSYNINSLVSLCALSKFYFVVKIINETSKWTTDISGSICNKHNVRTGLIFAVKCEFKERPFLLSSILFLLFLGVFSFILRTFEFGVKLETDKTFIGNNELQLLTNCFDLIVFTMTTVGYGDLLPNSLLGRIVCIVACIVGNLIIALIIASLAVVSEFSNGEKKAYSIIKKLMADDNALKKAAEVVNTLIRLRFTCRLRQKTILLKTTKKSSEGNTNRDSTLRNIVPSLREEAIIAQKMIFKGKNFDLDSISLLNQRFVIIAELKRKIFVYKNDYKIATSQTIPIDENLNILNSQVKKNLDNLHTSFLLLNECNDDINAMITHTEVLVPKLKNIFSMQQEITSYIIKNNNNKYCDKEDYKRKLEETTLNNISILKTKNLY